MKNDSTHIDLLILRHLSGEASEPERAQLEQWMQASGDNKKYFEQMRFVFESAEASSKKTTVDVNKAWQNVSRQMDAGRDAKVIDIRERTGMQVWLNVAALVIAAFGLSFGIFTWYTSHNSQQILSQNIISTDSIVNSVLADSSTICLNKHSKITYASDYGKRTRTVSLSGEAYFDVKHDADIPFVVNIGGVTVKDIGTAFNISAYPESDSITVFVASGEVAFYTAGNAGIRLYKGETGVYHTSTGVFNKQRCNDQNIMAYKTRNFVFNKTSLGDVIKSLQAVYPQQVILADAALADKMITVSFYDEDFESIMNIISETLDLRVSKTDGKFMIGEEVN